MEHKSYLPSTHDDDMRCETPSGWQRIPLPFCIWRNQSETEMNNFQETKLPLDDDKGTLVTAYL
jgi:hypothetical protein